MNQLDKSASPGNGAGRGALGWVLGCAVVALAVAAVPAASLFAQRRPMWLAITALLLAFPLVPLLWHMVAEASARGPAASTAGARFAGRTLFVALVVLGVSLAHQGPKAAAANVRQLVRHWLGKPAAREVAQPPPAEPFGLEPFIPADATLAVGLAGSAAMGQLLAAHGVDTRAKLAALATCKIDLGSARALVATRGSGTRMIVVRAPGLTEERNLYCLVGVMGPDRLQITPEAAGGGKTLQVKGLLSRPLTFRVLDPATLLARDEAWSDTSARQLFSEDGASASGPLAEPLGRVNRGAPLWVASIAETALGTWDLAIDSRQDGEVFKLRGSSTPPSGEKDRAEIAAQVPLGFAASLPETAASLGIRGLVAAIAASSAPASEPPPPPAPAPAPAPAAPAAAPPVPAPGP